jgi:3-oxoacyl-[acyl-carrier-protein] synthase-3
MELNKNVYFVSSGSYVPKNVMKNNDLKKYIETSDEWIYTRTGIKERRIADKNEAASDLAYEASKIILEKVNLTANDIDLIIMATITPDTCCPSGANWLEAKLNAQNAVSFDVTAACTGYLFAMSVAMQFLKTGIYKNALVIASEVMSRVVNWYDRETCILWGDGAGGCLLSTENKYSNSPVLKAVYIHSDGKNGQNLLMPGGGSKTTPISYESVDKKLHYLKMIHASDSLRVAVRRFSESCFEVMENFSLSSDDIDLVVPHQANYRILKNVAKKIQVPIEKFHLTIEKYGNSSSSSMAVALDEAINEGRVQKGDNIILTGFGGGLTWGSALIQW